MPMPRLLAAGALAMLLASPARAETVTQAMADSYRTNPTLAGARDQMRAVDEQVATALAAKRPTITASAVYGRLYSKIWYFATKDLPTLIGSYHYVTRSARLDASQAVYHGGALDAALTAAEAQVAVQEAQLTATEQATLNTVGTACADLILAAGGFDLAREYEAALLRARDGVAELHRLQDSTATDLAQAQSRLAQARAQTAQARAQLDAARAAFEAVVGRPPDGIPAPPALALPVADEDGAVEAALRDNPTMVAAGQAVAAAEAGQDVAFGNWLPSVDLSANTSFAHEDSALTILERTSTVKGRLTVPVYAGGAPTSRIRQAADLVAQRRYDLDDSREAVTAAARQAWQAIATADAILEARKRQVAAAGDSLEGVKLQYAHGRRTFLDTLDALKEWITDRSNLLTAQHDGTVARLQLLGAIGQLTARHLELPVPLYDPAEHLRGLYQAWLDVGQ